MQTYISHPAADLAPLMSGKDFDQLVQDIKANGVRIPIVVHENAILDGRNRYRAAQAAGLTDVPHELYSGDTTPEAISAFVASANLHRRHLTISQRAALAAKLANMAQGERTDLEPSANLQKVSQSDAAAKLNVSERSVAAAKKVRDAAPDLFEQVERGTLSLHQASLAVKAKAGAKPKLKAQAAAKALPARSVVVAMPKPKALPDIAPSVQAIKQKVVDTSPAAMALRKAFLAAIDVDIHPEALADSRGVLNSAKARSIALSFLCRALMPDERAIVAQEIWQLCDELDWSPRNFTFK